LGQMRARYLAMMEVHWPLHYSEPVVMSSTAAADLEPLPD
jgi:hypothetical protein